MLLQKQLKPEVVDDPQATQSKKVPLSEKHKKITKTLGFWFRDPGDLVAKQSRTEVPLGRRY